MRLVFPGGHVAISFAASVQYHFEYSAAADPRAPFAGIVVVHDDEVPPPRTTDLECRADGLWFSCIEEVPGEHWTFGLEAFGLRYDTAVEAATLAFGERIPVGYDLEWERAGDAGLGEVRGEILVGSAVIAVDGPGTFVS